MTFLVPLKAVARNRKQRRFSCWTQQFADHEKRLGAYSHLQSTRVQSLAYAMHGNPVAQAAWILERFHDWADLRGRSLVEVFGRDRLITSIMLHVMTDTFATSTWIYTAAERERARCCRRATGSRCPPAMPLGPTRDIQRRPGPWSSAPAISSTGASSRPAATSPTEEPEAFVADLRAWARQVNSD